MIKRTLRYAAASNAPLLRGDGPHDFAQSSATSIYRSKAVYSRIPKNACSTLRLSIAVENGAIEDERQFLWIHNNNDTFKATLGELATAEYTFAVLRCPYARLASCYLDKIVTRRPDAWHFHDLIKEAIHPANLTFRRFCQYVCKDCMITANVHWRPQSDFLVYKDYDDYFCVENFEAAKATLARRIGLKLIDARPLTKHATNRFMYMRPGTCHADMEAWQVEGLMRSGTCPHPASLYDAELRTLVAEAYKRDFVLYMASGRPEGSLVSPCK